MFRLLSQNSLFKQSIHENTIRLGNSRVIVVPWSKSDDRQTLTWLAHLSLNTRPQVFLHGPEYLIWVPASVFKLRTWALIFPGVFIVAPACRRSSKPWSCHPQAWTSPESVYELGKHLSFDFNQISDKQGQRQNPVQHLEVSSVSMKILS